MSYTLNFNKFDLITYYTIIYSHIWGPIHKNSQIFSFLQTYPNTSNNFSLCYHVYVSRTRSFQALAWHPYESGHLCIGGGYGNASLSLWNVNTLVPEGYRNVYFHGAVKNLAWNKRSAELVVNWSYFVQQAECTLMPVLGSLDRVVDMIMVDKDLQVNSIMWNPDHTQLGEFENTWNKSREIRIEIDCSNFLMAVLFYEVIRIK